MRAPPTTTEADENIPRFVSSGIGKLELLVRMQTVVLNPYQAALAQLFHYRGSISRFAATGIEEDIESL